jgi:zona occludens toxin
MSIFAYVGLPGSGKSYSVVKNQVIPALKLGRRVVTNLPLVRDEIRRVAPGGELVEFPTELISAEPEQIWTYCTKGSVVILDEVWRLWPAGQKTHQVPEAFKTVLAEHRHMVDTGGNSMQICLVTQDLAQIAVFARRLIEMTVQHTRLDHVGTSNRFRIDVYRGEVTGTHPPEGRRVRQMFSRYEESVFRLYRSHTQSDSLDPAKGANEKGMDSRGNVWRSPKIWLVAGAAVAGVAWAVPTLYGLVFGDYAATSVASAALATGPAGVDRLPVVRTSESAPVVVPTVVRSPLREAEAVEYAIAGFVRSGAHPGGGLVAIRRVDGEGGVVHVPWSNCWEAGDGLTRCNFAGQTVTELGSVPISQ